MKLIWLDLETTGLSPEADSILEVAVAVTDENLQVLEKYEAVLSHTEYQVNRWRNEVSPVVVEMHTKNGLWDAVKRSGVARLDAEYALDSLLRRHHENNQAPTLAGSSVHYDRMFLRRHMAKVDKLLHYRHFDVSVFKQAAKMWGASQPSSDDTADLHRAASDVRASIRTAAFYRSFFDPTICAPLRFDPLPASELGVNENPR